MKEHYKVLLSEMGQNARKLQLGVKVMYEVWHKSNETDFFIY